MATLDMLLELGHQPIRARNVAAALSAFEADGPVDVLLTDVNLPDGDGQTLATEIRRRSPAMPVVFATGYRMRAGRRRGADRDPLQAVSHQRARQRAPPRHHEPGVRLARVFSSGAPAPDRLGVGRVVQKGPAMHLDFTPISDVRCRIGESPVYDERSGRLYFVDIPAHAVHAVDIDGGHPQRFDFETDVGSMGLAASGRLVLALRDSVVLFDPADGSRTEICRIEAELKHTRLNDGRVGPDGAFWVGSMDERPERQPIGSLYRVDPSGSVERKVEGLKVSNGIAWSANGEVMYHADSRGPWIDRWDFDRHTGSIAGRRRVAELTDETGRPDGASCDVEGCYWSAGVSAGLINRFGPDGRLLATIKVPLPAPTMLIFAGPDYRTMVLTSLTEGRDAKALAAAPLAGRTLTAPSPVAGFPGWRFLDET